MIKIEVVEYKTNLPVADATVIFFKLGSFDLYGCQCWLTTVFLTKQTDESGYCLVTESDFNQATQGINISQGNYWSVGSSKVQTKYELDFIGQVKLHLIKTNSYPDQSFIDVSCSGERITSSVGNGAFYTSIADSTYTFNAFGGQTNTISWKVYAPAGASILDSGFHKVDVPKSGITDVEIQY